MTTIEHSVPQQAPHPVVRNAGYAPRHHSGWYFAAMLEDLVGPITPLQIGDRRLIVVRPAAGPARIYDAVCPHRGADLGVGGTLARAGVICPFHGKAVHLGPKSGARYWVGELPSFVAGGALFVGFDEIGLDDLGFRDRMQELSATHRLFACPPVDMPVPTELVTENAFDLDHFVQVHLIPRVTATGFGTTEHGAVFCDARFMVLAPSWDVPVDPHALIQNRFHATAYSPSLVVSELGMPGREQVVITTSVPTAQGCRIRVINGVRPAADGQVPAAAVRALTDGAAKAMAQDEPIWSNIDLHMVPMFDPRDEAVLLFREFCGKFASVDIRRQGC